MASPASAWGAAFQAARPRRALIENWQHWDWQHFHIGNTPRYILPGVTSIAMQLQKLVGTAVERRPYHRTLRNAVVIGGRLKRRQDGGCPS